MERVMVDCVMQLITLFVLLLSLLIVFKSFVATVRFDVKCVMLFWLIVITTTISYNVARIAEVFR